MEGDEIGVVLARAAELHIKLSDAIERTMKLEFQSGAGGPRYASIAGGRDAHQDAVLGYAGGRGVDLVYGAGGRGGGGEESDGSAEARSLGAIRDALEVLEEQLEALQYLQQQQRHERDAALVELEESRHILLRRLKAHRGREWEVVHEALAFAGEPVPDERRPHELPSPSPYHSLLETRSPAFHVGGPVRGAGAAKKLDMAAAQRHYDRVNGYGAADESWRGSPHHFNGEGDEAEYTDTNEAEEGTDSQQQEDRDGEVDTASKPPAVCAAGLRVPGDVLRLLVQALGVSARAIGVVTVVAVIGYSEVRKRKAAHRRAQFAASSRRAPAAQHQPRPPPPPSPRAPPPPAKSRTEEVRCPPGKVKIYVDDVPTCVVRERVELPFQQEVASPDVMYARG